MASGPRSSGPELPVLPGRGLADDELELGEVTGVFGVRGEVRVHLHNPDSDWLAVRREVVLVDPEGRRHRAVLRVRPGAGKRILGRIDGVDDRDLAASLKGWRFGVPKSALPSLDEGEFWIWQVRGLPVVVGERELGTVTEVHATGPVDVLEIHTSEGPRFLPMLQDYVEAVDVARGRVLLTADGLDALDEGA